MHLHYFNKKELNRKGFDELRLMLESYWKAYKEADRTQLFEREHRQAWQEIDHYFFTRFANIC